MSSTIISLLVSLAPLVQAIPGYSSFDTA